MKKFAYGTVLKIQREHSIEKIFEYMKSIKDLGMNTIVVWPAVFWWEDRTYPEYPFHTGCEILKYAEKIDVNIVFELAGQITSLEYLPDFMMKDEYYAVTNADHHVKFHSHYEYVNFNHPEVKQAIKKNFTDAAKHYKDYPALYGYDIWNETMFTSFDKYTLQLFREWLSNKYDNIEKLNDAWDSVYYDWSQIRFTSWMWASVMPVVDYQQFHKENVGMILKEWGDIIKEIDTDHPVIADNINSTVTSDGSYDRPQDDWNVAQNTDQFGISFYPKNRAPGISHHSRWQTLAGNRSAAIGGKFWISELQSHHQAMFNPFSSVMPYELKWWNWEAVSSGAKGIIYWKWHPFIKGIQTFGRGLVDHRGKYTTRAVEAGKICSILHENNEFMTYKPMKPKVAILYDKLNHDFTKAYSIGFSPYTPDSIYLDSIEGLYKCLWDMNIPADFITSEDIKTGKAEMYKVLFVTTQLNVDKDLGDGMKKFVSQGGTMVCDGRFGVVNDEGLLYEDIPGAGIDELTGCRLIEVDENYLEIKLNWEQKDSVKLDGYYEKQYLELVDKNSKVLGSFNDGNSAIVQTNYGNGQVLYLGTYLWYGYLKENYSSVKEFISILADKYEMFSKAVSKNNEIKINILDDIDGMIIFAFNYGQNIIKNSIELTQLIDGEYDLVDLYNKEEKTLEVKQNKAEFDVFIEEQDVKVFKLKKKCDIQVL